MALFAVPVIAQAALPATSPASGPETKPRLIASYGKLPLSFEVNRGQTASERKFLARGPGYGLFLAPTEAVLTLRKPNDAKARRQQQELRATQEIPPTSDEG
jgi:hypothetical protein